MKTILETIDAGTQYLRKHGIEDPRRNMQLLVAHQLHCTRTQLYTDFDRPLNEDDLAPLRELVRQRAEGIPLQHLLGTTEFYNHSFKTDQRALIPRPETEELVGHLLKLPLPPTPRILDMGTGSGVIGLSLAAAIPKSQVILADICEQALALARENADLLAITNARPLATDLFNSIPTPSQPHRQTTLLAEPLPTTFDQPEPINTDTTGFDLIVANLPYIPESERHTLSPEVGHDPNLALFGGGPDGLQCIRKFISAAPNYLNPGAWFALEVGHQQGEIVKNLLTQAGLEQAKVIADLSHIPRFPIARKSHT